MRIRDGRRQALAPRRGVTLVLVSISIMLVIGVAALAIDVSRITHYKSELKGITDVVAMSAALDLAAGSSQVTSANTNVVALLSANRIEGNKQATVTTIDPVTWNFTNRTASGSAWNAANAVRVIMSYQLNWTFGRIFGLGTGRTLVDTSVAALGQRLTHECLRPIVFPHSAVRSRLGLTPVGDTTSLTAANVFALRALTTSATYTVLDTVNANNASSFGWANTYQGSSGTAANIASALTTCVSGTLGEGSTLQARPKFGDTTSVRNAAISLCGGSTNCTTGTRMLVPIYQSGTNTTGSTTTTVTNNPAPNQPVSLVVDKKCYDASSATSFSNGQCSKFVSTLQTASTSSPVLINSGGTTVACRAGPTYTGRGTTGSGKKTVRYLYFAYTSCTTTTTTTVGSGRAAATYVIKYIATFVWTARTNTTITGYFTTINLPPAGAGTWGDTPGPVTSAVLVQ